MSAGGSKDEARQLALNYPFPPASIQDVLRFSDIYANLGLTDEAIEMLEKNLPKYGYSHTVWMKNAELLIQEKKWEELVSLAIAIRGDMAVGRELQGFSYFLQGFADFQVGRSESASEAFDEAVISEYPAPWLALHVATSLSRLGYSRNSKDLLLRIEPDFETNLGYWQLVFVVADDLKDVTIALKASKAVYDLNPSDRASINNYAAALIVLKQDPQTAISLTMKLSNWFPDSTIVKINHSLALLLNHRDEEARALLEDMNPDAMQSVVASSYYMAMFEIHVNEGNAELARDAAARIDRKFLYPVEIEGLEQSLARLSPVR